MYWQVYLHKTVLSAEKMLVNIILRAKELIAAGQEVRAASIALDFFLHNNYSEEPVNNQLDKFCLLDDYDVLSTIKNWILHPDKILSILCRGLVERRLFKVKLQAEPFDPALVQQLREKVCEELHITEDESRYFVFQGVAMNTTYDPNDDRINIVFKDGSVKDISQVDNALIHHNLAIPVKKFYICNLFNGGSVKET
jgi:HD superfamily phosphohydrolase